MTIATLIQQQQIAMGPFTAGPITPPPGPTLWLDLSNYTRELTDGGVDDMLAAGFVGVIVQAITGNDGRSYTRQQLETARRRGLRLQGYVWCFPGASPDSMRARLALFNGYPLEGLWLDVEQVGVTVADVNRDLALCDQYMGWPVGLYSGKWFFDLQGWSHLSLWADRPLWDSDYNYVPEVGYGFRPYGGWTMPAMSQYEGTSNVGRVSEVDKNVMA